MSLNKELLDAVKEWKQEALEKNFAHIRETDIIWQSKDGRVNQIENLDLNHAWNITKLLKKANAEIPLGLHKKVQELKLKRPELFL